MFLWQDRAARGFRMNVYLDEYVMKVLCGRLAVAALVGLLLVSTWRGEAGASKDTDSTGRNFEVRMQSGNRFNQDSITIEVGDSVTWINADDMDHTATSNDGGLTIKTGVLKQGTFSTRIVFSRAGTVPYHCEKHPATMKGEIIVNSPTPKTG
jgi:plastocyanin